MANLRFPVVDGIHQGINDPVIILVETLWVPKQELLCNSLKV